MGFGDFIKKKQEGRRERQHTEKEELQKVNDLLDRFEIPDFDNFFKLVLSSKPDIEYKYDKRLEKDVPINPSRKDYLDFIHDKISDGETSYKQIKDFAIKHNVVPKNFIGVDSDVSENINEFQNIINTIRREFNPEKITGEEHFQSQLATFLRAKFPDMEVEREVLTQIKDQIDILVDSKYAFELKVPKNRAELRNLSAQLEEYLEEYPKLCVVIADTSGRVLSDEKILNVTEEIKEYVDKYKEKLGVQTLVFEIGTRK